MICLGAQDTFKLVDHTLVYWIAWSVLVVPMLASAWTSLSFEKVAWCVTAALFSMSLILIGNGWFDKAAPNRVKATVVYKSRDRLTVSPSWRPPRRTETLDVRQSVYDHTHDLETISIDVHPGYFHLPWYDHIAPVAASD